MRKFNTANVVSNLEGAAPIRLDVLQGLFANAEPVPISSDSSMNAQSFPMGLPH